MSILPIRIYPDPILRVRCRPVERFDGELKALAKNMVETMISAPGVGLAAPQVGVDLRLCIVDVSVGKEPDQLHILVNPTVETLGPETHLDHEGCLSLPGLTEQVLRPLRIRVSALDLEGRAVEFESEGFQTRAICHELDHLDGVIFPDRLRGLRRERMARKLKKLVADRTAEAVR